MLVADEAQLLKNATNRARSLRELNARYGIAPSGTPVENRLEHMRARLKRIAPLAQSSPASPCSSSSRSGRRSKEARRSS
jgi:hypothetical protein